jgi:hypothetical protein
MFLSSDKNTREIVKDDGISFVTYGFWYIATFSFDWVTWNTRKN